MDIVLRLFCLWGVVGYFLILLFPNAKNKKQAITQLIISGPIGWAIFIPISIHLILKNRKGDKEDENQDVVLDQKN